MFEFYRKYLLIRYAHDTGTDDGSDHDTKRKAQQAARRYMREGWTTVACINTHAKRIEFITGEPIDVYTWFIPQCAEILRQNTKGATTI